MNPETIVAALWGRFREKFPNLPDGLPTLSPWDKESWWYDSETDTVFYPISDQGCRPVFVWFLDHELAHRALCLLGFTFDEEVFEEVEADVLALEILPKSVVGWLWVLVRWGIEDDLVREDGTLTEEGEELCRLYEATRDNPLWGQGIQEG